MKSRRDLRREMGVCIQCGEERVGGWLCAKHLEAQRANMQRYRERKPQTKASRAEMRARAVRRKIARGECLDCPVAAVKYRRCVECRMKEAARICRRRRELRLGNG